MSRLLSRLGTLLRSVVQGSGTSSNSELILRKVRLCLLTAVAGYDNKHTKYQTRIPTKWVYGDDACFLSKTSSSYVLGVADGVGGWRSYGVDPGRFSRAIMKNCERLVNNNRFRPDKLELLLAQCYEDVLNSKDPILGSATFCVISLQRDEHRVYAACLGDSGYLVIRSGCVIKRSIHQKHTFNTPFQLACPPAIQSGYFYQDLPNQAVQTSVEVKPGDIIIVGTDGLFDNLTESMILQEVKTVDLPTICTIESLSQCAKRLVERARTAAFTSDFVSPFASEARRYGINIAGGVPGDITVILGLVIEEDPTNNTIKSETTNHFTQIDTSFERLLKRRSHSVSSRSSSLSSLDHDNHYHCQYHLPTLTKSLSHQSPINET